MQALVPELDVSDFSQSIRFYVDVLGFKVDFSRVNEKFASLVLGDACIMMQEAEGPGRRFRTAILEYPYGRGINLQILVSNLDELYKKLQALGCKFVLDLETKVYKTGNHKVAVRQFVITDPDGYLLRLQEELSS